MLQNRKNVLITVIDSINQTTMPYNEFVLFRNKNYPEERQIILQTGNDVRVPLELIPEDIEIHKVGKNPIKIRKTLKSIISRCKIENCGWVIHLHSIRGSFSTLLAMIGIVSNKCTMYTIHSTFTGFKIHNKIFSFLDGFLAHVVTCVSKVSFNNYPRIIRVIKGNRILPIQNGVNTERIDFSLLNNDFKVVSEDKVCFVYIARMVPLKNHEFLIDVLKKIQITYPRNKVRFIFIGQEDPNGQIRKYAKKNGVESSIIFKGLIPREEVYAELSTSDVYISSSTLEGLPISLLEGMYCGLPGIISDIPQHHEIADGCDSLTILPFDVDIWASKIHYFSELTFGERKKLGDISRKYAVSNFSLISMHKKYDKIYDQIRSFK